MTAAASADWSVQPVSWPAGSQLGAFHDVSCVSASRCVAVGYRYDRRGNERPLIERSTRSGAWRIEPAPLVGHEGELDGVACTSATACTAVGSYRVPGGVEPLVVRWNGARWSLQQAETPPGWTGAFADVSCVSRRECVAVGNIGPSDDTYPLIERWSGGGWRIENPQNLHTSYLYGVSCASANACVAVGQADDQRVPGDCQALAERWNGADWSLIEPAEADCEGILEAVSCPAASECAAVGGQDVLSCNSEQDYFVPWAGRWDGRAWTLRQTPGIGCGSVRNEGDELTGLACVSTRDCLAVGGPHDSGTGPVIRRWNGRRWAVLRGPDQPHRGALLGVACVTRARCVAVGYRGRIYGSDPSSAPIVERGP